MLRLGYFTLLIFTLPTSKAQQDCSVPQDPENGKFNCTTDDGQLDCNLICSPGFSSYPRTTISCSTTSNWTMPPSSLICSPSVMLLTGSSSAYGITSVEIFSLNLICPTNILPNMTVWNFGHSLDYVDGHIYMCGTDWYSTEDYICWEMDEKNAWDQAPDRLNHPRGNHASAVVGSKLFLIGGDEDQTSSEVLDVSNTTEWKPSFQLRERTTEACAVTLSDGRVAVLGSWRSVLGPLLPIFEKHDGAIIYNPEDGSVQHLPHMNVGRKSLGCSIFTQDGKEFILAAGGYQARSTIYTPGIYFDSTEIYEVGSGIFGHWKTVGSLSREGDVRIEIIEEKIVAVQGNIVSQYDIEEEKWTTIGHTIGNHYLGGISPVPAARFGCA